MKRTHIVSLLVLVVAVPAATAGAFFGSSATTWSAKTSNLKPCFIAGAAGYQISGATSANYTARH